MKWWVVPAALGGVLVLGVAVYGGMTIMQGDPRGPFPWRMLRAASESMAPTIREGAELTARRKPASELKRGDVVAFYVGDNIWLQRVVGLPGDRIEMRDGLVVLNGAAVPQSDAGNLKIEGRAGAIRSEQLPGAAAYRVLDQGRTRGDDMPAIQVPAGKLFLLGDNRDNSFDSRFPETPGIPGGGLVPFDAVYGIVRPENVSG